MANQTSNGVNHAIVDKKIKEAIASLPKRYQTVMFYRYGIDSDPKTLEDIGDQFGVTRERIRQIEVKALHDLLEGREEIFQPCFHWLSERIDKEGGVVAEHHFLDKYGEEKKGSLLLALYLGKPFLRGSGTDLFHHHWYIDESLRQRVLEELERLTNHLAKRGALISEDEVKNHISRINFLKVSKVIGLSPLGAYGLIHWPEVMPKGVRDKAYIVLKMADAPLHFIEITKRINDLRLGRRTALKQTVHNELIKDERFILVGRGMYGLKEWGLRRGTVRDVLKQIFTEAKRPLYKDEIIPRVLKERLVRKNTIILNLNDSSDFMCLKDGRYTLKTKK